MFITFKCKTVFFYCYKAHNSASYTSVTEYTQYLLRGHSLYITEIAKKSQLFSKF